MLTFYRSAILALLVCTFTLFANDKPELPREYTYYVTETRRPFDSHISGMGLSMLESTLLPRLKLNDDKEKRYMALGVKRSLLYHSYFVLKEGNKTREFNPLVLVKRQVCPTPPIEWDECYFAMEGRIYSKQPTTEEFQKGGGGGVDGILPSFTLQPVDEKELPKGLRQPLADSIFIPFTGENDYKAMDYMAGLQFYSTSDGIPTNLPHDRVRFVGFKPREQRKAEWTAELIYEQWNPGNGGYKSKPFCVNPNDSFEICDHGYFVVRNIVPRDKDMKTYGWVEISSLPILPKNIEAEAKEKGYRIVKPERIKVEPKK